MSKSKNSPYWQSEPCPEWCCTKHRKRDSGSDRDHSSKWFKTLVFTLMEPRRQELHGGGIVHLKPSADVSVAQGYREVAPHIRFETETAKGIVGFRMTVAESLRLAKLLTTAADVAEGHAGGARPADPRPELRYAGTVEIGGKRWHLTIEDALRLAKAALEGGETL